MFLHNWKKELFTIPNLLSLFRLALIPVYMTIYLRASQPAEFHLAGGILALSCLTDLADGWVARRFHMTTEVGKLLDPLADKATQLSLMLCLSLRHPVLGPVVFLFVIKECFQLASGVYHMRRGRVLPGALMTGKLCTATLFLSFIPLVLFPNLPQATVALLGLADICALSLAFVGYVQAYFG